MIRQLGWPQRATEIAEILDSVIMDDHQILVSLKPLIFPEVDLQ